LGHVIREEKSTLKRVKRKGKESNTSVDVPFGQILFTSKKGEGRSEVNRISNWGWGKEGQRV